MPPKKKKGTKKKKKKEDGEITIEDKYRKTLDEIGSLKDQLAVRREMLRSFQKTGKEWKEEISMAQTALEIQQDNQQAVSADMTRQYKTMQTEMGLRIHQLESELQKTRSKLEQTQTELREVISEKEKEAREKDQVIDDLNQKIDRMESQFKNLLHRTFDGLCEKMEKAQQNWSAKTTMIQDQNKQTLLEFGLNPLDI